MKVNNAMDVELSNTKTADWDNSVRVSKSTTLDNNVSDDHVVVDVDKLGWCCCIKKIEDRETALIIAVSIIYFLALAFNFIPLKFLINERIGDGPEDPNSKSAFVDSTVHFIHSAVSFFAGRYTSGLSDYVGRKPILVLSCIFFIISRVLYLTASSPSDFYGAGVLAGLFDCFYFTALAWICDLFPADHRRSKRVGLFTGICGGFAFVFGVPVGK